MDDTKDTKVVGIGVGIILVIAAAVGIYLIVVRRPGAKPAMETPAARPPGRVARKGPKPGRSPRSTCRTSSSTRAMTS